MSEIGSDSNEFGRLSSEVRLQAILDTTIDAIIVIDARGNIESFNPAAEQIFGYKASEVINRNVKVLMPKRFADRHDGFLASYEETGNKKIIGIGREVECLRADGSVFPADLSVAEMVIEGERYYTGFLRDISERKMAEAEMVQNAARLKSILNTTVDGIIVIDENGRIESFNPAAEHLFGYSSDEAIGQNVKMLMPASYSVQHDRYLRNYLESSEPRIIGIGREVMALHKDGSTFPIDLAVSETRFGGTRHFTGVVRDITERKLAEMRLRESHEKLESRVIERTRQLEETNAELEMFAHGISHDLRAPLRAVAGYAGALREDYEHLLDADALGYLRSIADGVRRIDRLLNDLLALARLGRTEVNTVDVDLDDVMEEVQQNLSNLIEDKGAKITILGPLPTLHGYRSVVVLIVQNLVNNAIRYVPEERQPDVTVWAERENDGLHLCVQDNGEGIEAAWLKRVFEPFERLHARRVGDGSGLGLAIVKKGTQLHHGEAWVESTLGEGSVFHVKLAEPVIA